MNIRDLGLLYNIKYFFSFDLFPLIGRKQGQDSSEKKEIGKIKISNNNTCSYDVSSVKELNFIIEHFIKFPLISSKRNMFQIFLKIFKLYCNKDHLNIKGFKLSIFYINLLNNPINDKTLQAIKEKHGNLPNPGIPPRTFTINLL